MSKVKCIFCNQYRAKAKEHIWPKWLIEFMGDNAKGLFLGSHYNFFPWLNPLSTRIQSFGSLVYGNVCKICNNGWMSELENICSPLLQNVLIHKRKSKSWGLSETTLIAKWLFKTSIMINSGSNYRRIIKENLIKNYYITQTLPEKATVDFAFLKSERNGLEWQQNQTFILDGPENIVNNAIQFQSSSFNICIVLNDLIFRVSYWEDDNCVINPDHKDKCERLFPFERQIKFKKSPVVDSIGIMSTSIIKYD